MEKDREEENIVEGQAKMYKGDEQRNSLIRESLTTFYLNAPIMLVVVHTRLIG